MLMGQDQLAISAPERYRLTINDFLALDAAGVFADKGKFELIEGEVYQMSPVHAPHASAILHIGSQLLTLVSRVDEVLNVLSPVSVKLGDHSLPEPDLVVVRGPIPEKFVDGRTIVIVVEIAQSSLRYDLDTKVSLYADAAIPEYWIFDLAGRVVHQFAQPTPKGYTAVEVHPFGARVASKMVPQIVVDTSRIA